jgi:V-type H+-transporting ATPase subunit H
LLQEWVITKVNNSISSDFESEGPEVARQFCLGLLTLLANASPKASQHENDGIDIALIIMDTIATETPSALQIFRDYAQEAYLEAKKNPSHNAQILQAKRYLEVEKAKEDAFKTEVQLSGSGKSANNNTNNTNINPTAFTFTGEGDGQPPTFAVKDLSKYGHIHDRNMYTSLHQLLNLHGATPFQQRKAIRVICALISKNVSANHPIHQYIFAFLTSSLPHTSGNGVISLLDGLRTLLTNKDLHYIFITHNGIKALKHVLTTESKQIQAVYFAGYCLWLLSYNAENDIYVEQWGLIETMVSLLRTITRDKVVRIALLIFVNLIQRRDFVTILIGSQFQKILPVLLARKWKDQDIVKDLETLFAAVTQRLDVLSSFDQYIAEIRSGTLKKTPVHCERFWRENASKFDSADPTEDFLRKLIGFLSTSQDADCLEMAAYDIGEFARFHPDGKRILTRLGAKLPLMELMKHTAPEVNKAALLATQKLLIHKWDEMVSQNRAQGLRV